jgi:transcription factor TGA
MHSLNETVIPDVDYMQSDRGHMHAAASDSSDRSKDKLDQKTLRRLAQNREAARKSRLRKKAYVQQLENSRLKLTQLEQELHRARQQVY